MFLVSLITPSSGHIHKLTLSGQKQNLQKQVLGSRLTQNCFNPFVSNAPFLYPLKTSENRFLMFSGSKERVYWEQLG